MYIDNNNCKTKTIENNKKKKKHEKLLEMATVMKVSIWFDTVVNDDSDDCY